MILEVNRRKKQIRLSMKAVLPEPEESSSRPKRGRGGNKRSQSVAAMMAEADEGPKEPEHTAMEMAWQAALDRADTKKKPEKETANKPDTTQEQEEILARTLDQRVAS